MIYQFHDVFDMYCLCIPLLVGLQIISIINNKGYISFIWWYEIITCFWYICSLTKLLQSFLHYFSKFLALKTIWHVFYSFLQPVEFVLLLFYLFNLDFVLALSINANSLNLLISKTSKFLRHITLIEGKNTWLKNTKLFHS